MGGERGQWRGHVGFPHDLLRPRSRPWPELLKQDHAFIFFRRDHAAARPCHSGRGKPMDQPVDQFYLLAESSPDAIFVAVDERFAYLNPAALHLFGATSTDQLLGQPILDRIHQDDRAFAAERSHRLQEEREGQPRHEHRYLKLDGTSIDVEVSAVPFRYNGADGALAFLRNVTRRKRAEEELLLLNQELERRVAERTRELHAKEGQLQEILNALPIAVFTKDREGRYLGCNRVFTEVMGVTADEIRGKAVFELWPSDLARVYHEKDLELMAHPEHQMYDFQVRDRFKQLRQVMYA